MALETSIDDPPQVFNWLQDHRRHGRSQQSTYACTAPTLKNKPFSFCHRRKETSMYCHSHAYIHTYITSSYQGSKFDETSIFPLYRNFLRQNKDVVVCPAFRVCIFTSMLHPHIHEAPAGHTSLVTPTIIS